jgi:hypothetical protein
MKKNLSKLLLAGALFAGMSFAESDPKAYEIAKAADAMQRNFKDEKSKSEMILINANGEKVTRNMVNLTLERDNAEDYQIVKFLNPADVRGTGLLTHQNPKGSDNQWLYLPDLRRVKKISSSSKSGSFMGSEFTYEDITGNTLDKWDYKFIEESTLDSKAVYVLEKTPNYENSGYSKVKVWFLKDTKLSVRSEFFDRKGSLLKVQKISGWKKYGTVWRSSEISMENLQTKKQSILTFSERKIGSGLTKKDFSKRSLQRQIKY